MFNDMCTNAERQQALEASVKRLWKLSIMTRGASSLGGAVYTP
eukprot:gene5968-5252_t